MIFDPIVLKTNGFSEGMLNFLLGTRYDASRPMGNVARSELNVVVSAWLVGLQKEVASVVPRCLDWITTAIDDDEKFGANQNLHRTNLHWAKAMADWMNGGLDSASWASARVFEEAAWRDEKRPWPMNEIIQSGLDDYMAFAYQAGDDSSSDGLESYESGIQIYEHWLGKQVPSLSKTLKPREFAYALCLHRVRSQFSRDELFKAGRRMLRANLEAKWLGAGQFIRGATWLKIVYGNFDPALTPLQTILKAYDDMPNVARPQFIGA
jgi:hypothetical protein